MDIFIQIKVTLLMIINVKNILAALPPAEFINDFAITHSRNHLVIHYSGDSNEVVKWHQSNLKRYVLNFCNDNS